MYEYLGLGTQLARQREFGFWAQDSWRMRPDLSLNYGLRYELQFPFVALNNSYSIGDYNDVFGVSGAGNLFKPGTLDRQPADVPSTGRERAALPDGLEQSRAEHRRGVVAHRRVAGCCGG